MQPTREQIEVAAYHRWERRGYGHGGEHDDWSAAEKDLTFGLNYRYVARLRLDPAARAVRLGHDPASRGPRRCRFCEREAPAVAFGEKPLWLPWRLGPTSLIAWDECDDCRSEADAHLAAPFAEFLSRLDAGAEPEVVPVAVLKGLARLALSVMPAAELPHFTDSAEWVANPEHARDAAALGPLGCHLYLTPGPVPAVFTAVALRVDAPRSLCGSTPTRRGRTPWRSWRRQGTSFKRTCRSARGTRT
jgi:hypothetical protein